MGRRLLAVSCALIVAGCASNAVIVPRSSASPAALRWTTDPVKHTATPAPTAPPTAAPPTAKVTV
ncbi:MAG: YgdI/YgdR family lipoprotein, partial [Candidatus Dormibacteraeota bacterium]|nr:YgdI/YgdR family lipoprotein [Candidatus Dormibacteraeota bacterium]